MDQGKVKGRVKLAVALVAAMAGGVVIEAARTPARPNGVTLRLTGDGHWIPNTPGAWLWRPPVTPAKLVVQRLPVHACVEATAYGHVCRFCRAPVPGHTETCVWVLARGNGDYEGRPVWVEEEHGGLNIIYGDGLGESVRTASPRRWEWVTPTEGGN